MKSFSLLGSTGSVGKQALDVVRAHSADFSVEGLACYSHIELLKKQIAEFSPQVVAVYDEQKAEELSSQVDIDVLSGMSGLVEIAQLESSDTLLNSLIGSIGIVPTVEAIKAKKNIALANKETLVSAGEIVMRLAQKNSVQIMPIDSEHSAVFQCLNGERREDIHKIVLTCSGGPFREQRDLSTVTKEQALKHPSWNMGKKITIDSATLMNKGLEVIEAKMLFGVDYDDIDVVIHPQSTVHSLVEFKDKSVMAHMGPADMRIPIQYALSYPSRFAHAASSLDLSSIGSLHFSSPDLDRFPCLTYAYDAGKQGGSLPCVMNAANEVAVNKFLNDEIQFLDIARFIKEKMENHTLIKNPELDELLDIDKRIKNE